MTRAIDQDIKLANIALAPKPRFISPNTGLGCENPVPNQFFIIIFLIFIKEILIRPPLKCYLEAAG